MLNFFLFFNGNKSSVVSLGWKINFVMKQERFMKPCVNENEVTLF